MTKEELVKRALYIQYASPEGYKEYNIDGVNRLPYHGPSDMYGEWKRNEHHFTTEYHRKYVIPLLCELLNLSYNENDFILLDRKYCGFDISILKPKKEFKYEVYGYTRGEHIDNLTFNDVITNNSTRKDITEYHRLYRYGHECSRLINKTIDNDRKLFISGDSQMIPDISFLSCFFKEVWYFDNRDKKQNKHEYIDRDFTDVIIEIGCGTYNDYMVKNFM